MAEAGKGSGGLPVFQSGISLAQAAHHVGCMSMAMLRAHCGVWLLTLTGGMALWPCAKSDQSGWSRLDL